MLYTNLLSVSEDQSCLFAKTAVSLSRTTTSSGNTKKKVPAVPTKNLHTKYIFFVDTQQKKFSFFYMFVFVHISTSSCRIVLLSCLHRVKEERRVVLFLSLIHI